MLRVDHARWGQTAEDLRRLATSAPHLRTRERFLALYEVTQESCATRVAARTRRHPQTVMEWRHLYNTRGPEALAYRRTGGRPPLPRCRGRPRRGGRRRPAHRGGAAPSRGRPSAALDLAAPGRLGARGVRSPLLPRDDPRRPASPGAVVEEGQEAARPSRPAAQAGLCRAGPGSAGKRPARAASAGLSRRGADPSRCRARSWLVGARPALLGRLGLAAFGGQALLLWPLSLQRGRGAALALRPRQRRAHQRCSAPAAGRMARPEAAGRLGRRSLSSRPYGAPGSRRVADRARTAAGYSPDFMPVEALWRWLREDVTYHHCHPTADDLSRRVAAFQARLHQDRCAVADRLWVKDQLDPEEEKLRFPN